jgi:hypothetical protein
MQGEWSMVNGETFEVFKIYESLFCWTFILKNNLMLK